MRIPNLENIKIEVVKYCIELNESLKNDTEENTLKDYFDLFLTNFDEFEDKARGNNDQMRFKPFWTFVDLNKVYRRIKRLENEQIWKLGHYFSDRYRVNIFEELYPEKDFVINLLALIDNRTKARTKRNLKNASLNYLSKCLSDCLKNFPK